MDTVRVIISDKALITQYMEGTLIQNKDKVQNCNSVIITKDCDHQPITSNYQIETSSFS